MTWETGTVRSRRELEQILALQRENLAPALSLEIDEWVIVGWDWREPAAPESRE